jgi:hypothetical protein
MRLGGHTVGSVLKAEQPRLWGNLFRLSYSAHRENNTLVHPLKVTNGCPIVVFGGR